jgi:hypothetical protein
VPPEAEPIENSRHHSWCVSVHPPQNAKVCHRERSAPSAGRSGAYEAVLVTVGNFDVVELCCWYFSWLELLSKREPNSTITYSSRASSPCGRPCTFTAKHFNSNCKQLCFHDTYVESSTCVATLAFQSVRSTGSTLMILCDF